jgi:hypothetical protein
MVIAIEELGANTNSAANTAIGIAPARKNLDLMEGELHFIQYAAAKDDDALFITPPVILLGGGD